MSGVGGDPHNQILKIPGGKVWDMSIMNKNIVD